MNIAPSGQPNRLGAEAPFRKYCFSLKLPDYQVDAISSSWWMVGMDSQTKEDYVIICVVRMKKAANP
jgi:hypothetical protein